MAREVINGTVYINGYLCNDAGQPITMNNGYSSEEEQEARTAYQMAKYYARPKQQEPEKKRKKTAKKRNVYVAPLEDERWK
jgi:hypothetical protein